MIRPDFRRDAKIGAQESRAQFVTSLVTNLGATVRVGLEEESQLLQVGDGESPSITSLQRLG